MDASSRFVTPVFKRIIAAGLMAALLASALALAGCASEAPVAPESDAAAGAAAVQEAPAFEVTVVLCAYPDAGIEDQEVVVGVPEGATAFDALMASGFDVVASDSEYGKYVAAIEGLEAAGASGWMYTLNGEPVMESCDSLVLAAGDSVEWAYLTW